MLEHIFHKNLSALCKKDPILGERLAANLRLPKRWTIHSTKSGLFTLSGYDLSGKELYLHSKYDPVRESQQLVNSYEYDPTSDIVFLGFGLGYHIEEVLRRPCKHGLILVVEADMEIVCHAFQNRDLTSIINHPQVIFSVAEDSATLFNRMIEHSISILANNLSVLEHPTSIKCYTENYNHVRKTLNDFYTWARVNANTQIARARDFAQNILANVPEYIQSIGIKPFFNAFKGQPAFIVSAGPSLDKNVYYLKEVAERGLIICVDSALKTLLDNDIIPDLVVSIDFGKNNNKYFENIPSEHLSLAFDPEVYPEIPQNFRGKKFAMNLPGKALCDWLTEKIGDKGCISKGLSVSHSAFSLAIEMGASPIILVGQDLSYPRGAWHSKGSGAYQKAEISQEVKERFVDIDGYFGGRVKSETSFTVFLSQFESILSELKVECYNATEGGAKIHGIEAISLRDAIRRFCVQPIDKDIFNIVNNIDEYMHDFEIFKEEAARIIQKLTNANHHAYKAFALIENMITSVKQNQMDKQCIIDTYKQVIRTIEDISSDQEILKILKDNAIEALIVRAKREMININDISVENTEPILKELYKEKVFFRTLVNACDFLSKEFSKAHQMVSQKLENKVLQP